MKNLDYVLTTFSPAMFGTSASIHLREVDEEEAKSIITDDTAIVANRDSHMNMARNIFGTRRTLRYADMQPDRAALIINYRGPPVPENGEMPDKGIVTFFLVEVDEYLEPE